MSTACGRLRPPMCSSSTTSSKLAESLAPVGADRQDAADVAGDELGVQLGLAGAHPVAVAACTVLISPLCAMSRNGWASDQLGKVLVENRECTMARALAIRGSRQVREELLQLPGGQHALVDERARAQAREVDVRLALGALAQAEGAALQGHRVVDAAAAGRRTAAGTRGIVLRAVAPTGSAWIGTSRQPRTTSCSSSASRSTAAMTWRRSPASAGRNAVPTA